MDIRPEEHVLQLLQQRSRPSPRAVCQQRLASFPMMNLTQWVNESGNAGGSGFRYGERNQRGIVKMTMTTYEGNDEGECLRTRQARVLRSYRPTSDILGS